MPNTISIEINGETVFFETDEDDNYQTGKMGVAESVHQVVGTFEKALDTICLVSGATISRIRKLKGPDVPDEFELQFGVKLSGEYGAVVAKAAGEAQLSVTLTYKRNAEVNNPKKG